MRCSWIWRNLHYHCRVSVFSTGSSFLCCVAFSSFSTAYWSIWFLRSKGGKLVPRILSYPPFERTLGTRLQGWRSGESARLPPMWPWFESRLWGHIWVEFVVGSLLCSEGFFSGYSDFPLSSKTNTYRFQFDLDCTDTFKRVYMKSYVLSG